MASSVREYIRACQAGSPRTEFRMSALPQVGGALSHSLSELMKLTGLASGHNALIRLGKKTEYQLGAPLSKRDLTEGWYLGDQGDLNGEFWEGDIAELLVYDAPLSKAEFATDLKYLQTKWLPKKK